MVIASQSEHIQLIHIKIIDIGQKEWVTWQMFVYFDESIFCVVDNWLNQSDFQIGKQQQFALGQFLRRRYRNLLGDGGFSSKLVHVQSTDIERALMSALCMSAGLFPPAGSQVWNENIPWQPIPVYTMPRRMDHILAADRPCPRYKIARKNVEKSDEICALNKRLKPLYKYLTKNSGKKVNSIVNVRRLYNTLYIEELKNLT